MDFPSIFHRFLASVMIMVIFTLTVQSFGIASPSPGTVTVAASTADAGFTWQADDTEHDHDCPATESSTNYSPFCFETYLLPQYYPDIALLTGFEPSSVFPEVYRERLLPPHNRIADQG
ncbi:hypothetical protein [Geobacter sp. DSM 9736]|uniref:hypothetical protein n=1 Tax=Geobacter sp. DSM 9736 TaxID=1277350 RepID=UPI000B506C5B|nr:hypothetical protein [Geobacter sp. DSM 9736]SNB46883.1 hypothetical protein SAMN06269301_2354 [Geobacter sp. DSM 9736]